MKKSFIFGLLAALVVSTTFFTGCEKKEEAKVEEKQVKEEITLEDKAVEKKVEVAKTNEKKQANKETEYEKAQNDWLKAQDKFFDCKEKYGAKMLVETPPECKELERKKDELFNKYLSTK
ncbi:MAG: hypothetical protein LBG67_05405 [Campylobacteraceae bacterium]|jgi:outer membrane murein-binding lipoprotein Lpp|nr:hypothetical protein [Campylobacteraceae bacterium]